MEKKKVTMVAINHLSEQELVRKCAFLLEKVEWDGTEMQWLLAYLEQTDGLLLQNMLYEAFLNEDVRSGSEQEAFGQSRVKRKLHRKLFG